MKYTRRTFIDVSSILNQFENFMDSHVFQDLVFEFSELFLADNPNFDEARFWDACVKTDVLV
jgi:hypothetical protein